MDDNKDLTESSVPNIDTPSDETPSTQDDENSSQDTSLGNGYNSGLAASNREAFERGLGKGNSYEERMARNRANMDLARARANNPHKMKKGHEGEDEKIDDENPENNNFKDKNFLDKVGDKANLARNKAALLGSQIDNVRSKAFKMMHPIEAAKIVAKKKIQAWLLGILAACLPFILGIFLVIIVVVVIAGDLDDNDNNNHSIVSNEYMTVSSSGSYWWPIGGSEIEVKNGVKYTKGNPSSVRITSKFSNSRTIQGVTKAHNGIDVGRGSGSVDYIIASKDGIVYTANDSCPTDGYYGSRCGGGYGNYVIIFHKDGNYSIYAHMAKNTITVKSGDVVYQGQVLGEMGNSGSSTGAHLHYQIDVGGYSNKNAVDPLTYVSTTNPYPKIETSNVLTMLHLLEGSGPTSGDYYIAYHGAADASDVITIGHGVVIKYNIEKFKARGYSNPVLQIKEGTKVHKSVIDDIEMEILTARRNNIVNKLNNNSISLYDYQIDALLCRDYNIGNVNSFYTAYKQYGTTQALYDNYMNKPVTANGSYVKGLETRRKREWKLFSEGLYYGVDYK